MLSRMANTSLKYASHYASEAAQWINGQIAVAKTSEYGVVRFLGNNASLKNAIILGLGVLALTCFGKAAKNYNAYRKAFGDKPVVGETVMTRTNGARTVVTGVERADAQDVTNWVDHCRIQSSLVAVISSKRWAIGQAIAGTVLAATAVAVAVLMPQV